MIRMLPWVAAFGIPAIGSALGYWVVGANLLGMTVGGVLAGVTGLAGAGMYWVTRALIDRRYAVQEIEVGKLAAGVLEARITTSALRGIAASASYCCEAGQLAHPDPCPWHYEPPHEGVAPHRPPPDYEPPTRG